MLKSGGELPWSVSVWAIACPSSVRPRNSWEDDVMWEDPIVAEVRRAREELSARFNFDVKAIFADLRNRQAALGGRLVTRKKRAEPVQALQRESRATADSTGVTQ